MANKKSAKKPAKKPAKKVVLAPVPKNTIPGYLSTAQLAEFLDVSKQLITRMTRTPFYREIMKPIQIQKSFYYPIEILKDPRILYRPTGGAGHEERRTRSVKTMMNRLAAIELMALNTEPTTSNLGKNADKVLEELRSPTW